MMKRLCGRLSTRLEIEILRSERDARLIIKERFSARTEALKRAAKQKKQFEIADNPAGRVLKVSAGRIMERTLPSGEKSVCGGV